MEINKSLIYGTLLGDASIYRHPIKNFYTFRFSQANKTYAIWKADLLGFPYKHYTYIRYDNRTKKNYTITIVQMKIPIEERKRIYSLFYTPKKKVNKEILEALEEQGITLWYLDDGNVYYNGNNCHITLAINGFSTEEGNMIIKWFKDKYNLNFKYNSKAIRLTSKKDCLQFMNIVEKYIPECMSYKILNNAINKHKLKPKKIRANPPSKKIIQFSKEGMHMKTWNSVKEASNELKITVNSIYCNLSNKCNLTKKYKWKYA